MRPTLSIRIFLGFVAIMLVFSGATLYSVWRMDAIRRDLQLTAQGFLQLTRELAKFRTIAESKNAYVQRALAETDPRVRQYLVRYARDFYPRVLRERLEELTSSARALSREDLSAADVRFTREVAERLSKAAELNRAAEQSVAEFFERLADPEQSITEDSLQQHQEANEALLREIKLIALNLDNKIAQSVLRAGVEERNAVWAVVALAVTVLVVGFGITLLMNRALRPLKMLTESAYAISRGGFDVHIPADRADEIGTLAQAFNDMARGLKDREQVLAQRSLDIENLNAFLEDVLHSVATGVVVCNRDRTITVVNRVARRLLGLTLSDPVGKRLEQLPIGPILEPFTDALASVLDQGPPLRLDARPLRPSEGPPVLIDLRVQPFTQPGAPGNVGGIVVLIDDVSERERTRERLLQSERLAAMGRLAAQVAHEIRNPLSSIGLNCELIADELQDRNALADEVQRLLAAISHEIDRLSEITEGYLRYARLPDAAKRIGDVSAVVVDVTDFVRPDFERQGLRLQVEVSDHLPPISHDPSRLRLALLNLLRNAADVSPPGASVDVQVSQQDNAVRIAVLDQGPGVPEALAPRLFEPFFSTKKDGTGLGLSVTRDVAIEHGGQAVYEPRATGGACFALVLASGFDRSA